MTETWSSRIEAIKKELCGRAGLKIYSDERLARKLKVTLLTIRNWKSGKTTPSEPLQERITKLEDDLAKDLI